MSDLVIKAVLAGIFFGVWPLFMNRSGLGGNVSSAVFALIVFIMVFPFAIKSIGFSLPAGNWLMVVLAGIFGALGLLSFNGMLAGVSSERVGSLFVVMIIVQIAIPAIYQVFMTGELPVTKAMGFILAVGAAFFLL